MSTETKRATIYLDPKIHKALKIKSVQSEKSISELVNDAVRISFAEDFEDLLSFEERKNEPNLDFKIVVKDLKARGKI